MTYEGQTRQDRSHPCERLPSSSLLLDYFQQPLPAARPRWTTALRFLHQEREQHRFLARTTPAITENPTATATPAARALKTASASTAHPWRCAPPNAPTTAPATSQRAAKTVRAPTVSLRSPNALRRASAATTTRKRPQAVLISLTTAPARCAQPTHAVPRAATTTDPAFLISSLAPAPTVPTTRHAAAAEPAPPLRRPPRPAAAARRLAAAAPVAQAVAWVELVVPAEPGATRPQIGRKIC